MQEVGPPLLQEQHLLTGASKGMAQAGTAHPGANDHTVPVRGLQLSAFIHARPRR